MKYTVLQKPMSMLLMPLILLSNQHHQLGVDRMGNETEEREIVGMDYETEGVDSDNEGVDNKVLPPKRKGYIVSNPPQYQLQ